MPTIGDYDDAIRAGRVRFKDPELKTATPEINKRPVKTGFIEEPWRAPGSFAVAYKMKLPDGRLRAIRCYFAENAQHSGRYRVLHTELPAKLKDYTVDFRYIDQGIRADSSPTAKYLPVVDMEWVQGRELRQYVAHIADNNDTRRINDLAEAWLTMISRMRAVGVAHGDLSGNNIMVRDNGALVLIDYDGMYTPGLANLTSNEAGAPEYQHPTSQDRRPYGPEMDRFSALLIYVALRALIEQPAMWKAHSEYSGNGTANLASDRMLFKAEDLKSPHTSQLFRELGALRDPLTLKLVAALKQACVDDISRTPWVVDIADPMIAFKAAIQADNDQQIIAAASDPSVAALPAARPYDARVAAARKNLATLPALRLALHNGDDDEIASAWASMTETASTLPFKAQVAGAVKRAGLTTQLREAIRTIDYPSVQRIETELRGHWALAPYKTAIHDTYVRYSRLTAIERALDTGADDVAIRIWDLAIQDAPQAVYRERLDALKPRVEVVRDRAEKVRAAKEAVLERDDLALVGLWNAISAAPAAQDMADAAQKARERVAAIPQLKAALDGDHPDEAVRIWETNQLDGRKIAAPYGQAYQEAYQRHIERLDPRDVSIAFRGPSLLIRWEWPEGVTATVVSLDTATFPAAPRQTDPTCLRDDYQRQGGFLVTPPPAERYFIRLFSLVLRRDGAWIHSPGSTPSASVSIARQRTILYEIVRTADGAALRARSQDASPLPDLLVYAQSGAQIASPNGTQPLARIDARSAEARQGQVTLPLDFSTLAPGKVYVRVFPDERDPGARATGQPADNIEYDHQRLEGESA